VLDRLRGSRGAEANERFEGVGGKFIVNGKERRSSDESYDEEKARRLWEMSWAWCGLDVIDPV
jgi:hypothetical protein